MTQRRKRGHPGGIFLTLEGPEGSGKSTQISFLTTTLRQAGYSVVSSREPGGTKVAEAIRQTLLSGSSNESITPETEALLVLAARSQHVTHMIRPALSRGSIVLCDRFADSTFAYQGFGRGLSLSWLERANRTASRGLARRRHARGSRNRLDRESIKFHERVRKGFLTLASRTPRRIKIINADRPVNVVRAEIEALVLGWLRTRKGRSGTG